MIVLQGRNVNYIYAEALWRMKIMGVDQDSRNGRVKRILGPVATVYDHPMERMLRDVKRDANPFFHIFESIWMLAGRNDVKWVERFNSNIGQFSDNGETLHGAYGFRWREHWEGDQIWWLIDHLKADPTSRRAVIQMFDPEVDQPDANEAVPKDIPCNTAIYFEIVEGALNMTVTNRSNDMIWGAYGANAVHMSILQEFVANALGVSVGRYVQFSNNFHIYQKHWELLENPHEPTHYTQEMVRTHVPLTTANNWKHDLIQFEDWCAEPIDMYTNHFILFVLGPMMWAWKAYKEKDKMRALTMCEAIRDAEIRIACFEWLTRRKWEAA